MNTQIRDAVHLAAVTGDKINVHCTECPEWVTVTCVKDPDVTAGMLDEWWSWHWSNEHWPQIPVKRNT